MDLEFWASTDVGRVRDHNEDNFLVDKRMRLFVVCDGMGGHAAGEVASAMGVQIVREVVSAHREVFEALAADPESLANRKSVLRLLEHAIQEACARIYGAAQEDPSKRGMGTTCSALLLAAGRGFIGHVGDSRIYLFRQEKVHQITEDHSLINEMIRLGKIKPGEEHHLPHKNAVTRAVGVNEFVEVDTFELDVQGDDAFLVCSDGLSGYFKNEDQILDLLDNEDPREVTEKAIEFANAGGGKDNITAIVVRVTSDPSQKRDVQKTMEVLRATPYFQYLSYKEMVQIVNLSRMTTYEREATIFEEGADPAAMFMIASGSVEMKQGGRVVARLRPGDCFAETSIMDETPQRVGAFAADDVALLGFGRDRFMELLRAEPNLAVKLLWNFLQTFAFHIRSVPYETLVGDRAQRSPEDHTPPAGTLVFEEDLKRAEGHRASSVSGEFVAPTPQQVSDAQKAAVEETPSTAPAESEQDERSERATVDRTIRTRPTTPRRARDTVVDLDPDATLGSEDFAGGIKDTIPARSALTTDELAWDDIVPRDLLEDEASLRKTVQMDREVDDKARTHEALTPAAKEQRSSRRSNGLGKAISGESVVRDSTPQAQVLKRTKLVVGDDRGFDTNEQTRDVKPLQKREPDSTLELDIADENVEELP